MKYYKFFTAVLICAVALFPATGTAQGPFNIGTIHPGDSILVIYDVQINNPLVPSNTSQISNQGTVSGANFANQVTDDPDSSATSDPTITQLNTVPLPLTLTEFKAYQKLEDVELAWKVNETDVYKYEVERSTDGRTFTKIGEVIATGAIGLIEYTFLDANPFAGDNFYRLKIIDIDKTPKFTNIVRVSFNNTGAMLVMYPNPVREKMLNIEMKALAKGTYYFTMYNNVGQKVFSKQIDYDGTSASEVIYLSSTITNGIYYVQVSGQTLLANQILLIE
jgi:hypothetical protein